MERVADSDRGAARRARAHADARPGEAAARGGLRRGRGARRLLADGRGGRDAARGLAAALGRRRRSAILSYRVPRGVVGVITPWNWPYTMPAELIAPALASGNAVVWMPAPSTVGLRGGARRVHRRRRAAARRLLAGHGAGAGGRRRGRRQPGHASGRLHRLDRDRAAGRAARGRKGDAARARRQRPDGRARRCGRRRRQRRRASPRRSSAPGRAAPRASASSSTRPCTTSSSSGCRRRSSARCGSATRFAEETTMGPLNNEATAAEDGPPRRGRDRARGEGRHRR